MCVCVRERGREIQKSRKKREIIEQDRGRLMGEVGRKRRKIESQRRK